MYTFIADALLFPVVQKVDLKKYFFGFLDFIGFFFSEIERLEKAWW